MTEKVCRVCGLTKVLEEFFKVKDGKYGRDARCKECRAQERVVG